MSDFMSALSRQLLRFQTSAHRQQFTLAILALATTLFVAFGGLNMVFGLLGFLAASLALTNGATSDDRRDESEPINARVASGTDTARQATPLWQQVLDASPDAMFVLNREQVVIYANANAQGLLPEATGRNIATVTRNIELLSAVQKSFSNCVEHRFEMKSVLPIERHLSGISTSLRSDGPSDPVILVSLRDHTEADQLSQMRADFVANASHELRTPLASLKGFVETLQGAAKDDPKARENFLPIMQEQAARMTRLIEDLLSLSRIEMREHIVPTERVDLGHMIGDVVTSIRPLADAASIKLSVEAPTVPIIVIGDRDDLTQVMQNLIQNGIKYGNKGGKVEVTIVADERRVRVTVADDGIGIAPQHLPRLTERFYRVSAKDSRERGGTGLGLAIVKHIVNRHRGTLEITSQLKLGSRFTVVLDRYPT
jgi:two-component system, OmpR family, phosphate regulon sensor histidine kinase PhoR